MPTAPLTVLGEATTKAHAAANRCQQRLAELWVALDAQDEGGRLTAELDPLLAAIEADLVLAADMVRGRKGRSARAAGKELTPPGGVGRNRGRAGLAPGRAGPAPSGSR